MIPHKTSGRPRQWILFVVLAAFVPVLSGAERTFSTPPPLGAEAQTLVALLEQYHYNRAAVHISDYSDVIPSYMEQWDPQHLFFLATDESRFLNDYGKEVYYNAQIGNIDPAYSIFNVYQSRVEARVQWVLNALKGPFDFTTDERYGIDRAKSPWPATAADADELWHRRLKFELLDEMLNKKTLEQAKTVVHDRYERMPKNLAELDGGDLAETYLTCIAGLYDPHSSYLSADTYADFGIQMKLELVGIGAMLEMDDEYCTVKEIVPGSPADLDRRLKPGDKIIAVAQQHVDPATGNVVVDKPVEIVGMKLRKVVEMIRGQKQTQVRLTIQPGDATDPATRKEIVLTRNQVKLNSARAHAAVFQVPGPDGKPIPLGVIRLPSFYGSGGDQGGAASDEPSASRDIAQLIVQLQAAGIKGLVLDLRRNGGGLLPEAINVTGLFIRPGPVVQVRDADDRLVVDPDEAAGPSYDGPMAVLVDRFSASASEIVAGALQNYGRAIVVGDRSTHGKGSVQTVVEMKNVPAMLPFSYANLGAAKVTVQKFYLPNGASTQLNGVRSDIALPSVDDDLPIGESDLPHALNWDRITAQPFDGAPLDPKFVDVLRKDSLERQSSMEEFAYLRKGVDWFEARLAEKQVSLNLAERTKEKAADDAHLKEMDAERDRLAKADWTYKEYRLGPPLPGPVQVKPKDNASPDSPEDDDTGADAEAFGKVDVHLREALRILVDGIGLGADRQFWADSHPPLALAEKG